MLTVFRRREKVHYCSHEKETGALLFQEKKSGVLLFSREGNWCSIVFRRRDLVINFSQEKKSGALLFSGGGNRCSKVFRRE